jgi:NAD(P)-dependent dehydrogenase (short-subunit alcohol dehydrogenase family)
MAQRFAGKLALVTGGTGGLGRAVSVAFLSEGAKVAVTYREQKELDELTHLADAYKNDLSGHRIDITDDAAVERFVEQLSNEYGHLDILVNTVGGFSGGVKLWDTEPSVFDRMMTLNLRSGYTLIRAAVPRMLATRSGVIVNVASKAAVDHAGGASGYVASKAAAVAMIDSLAADLKGTGVRANSVLPSIIDTEANRRAMPNANFDLWPKPEDIARVILYLCSEEARLIHGASIPVYGDA